MTIGLVLSFTPGYSETFFRSKIKGLQKNGVNVILFCYRKDDDFNLCPVKVGVKVSRNPIVQGWYFLVESVCLLPHLLTLIRYIKLERKEGTYWKELPQKIYYNAHILKAKLDWLHFGFSTMALGSETVAEAIGAKMAVSFRGFDITVYPLKNPGCYNKLWKYVDKIHTISISLIDLAKAHGMPENSPFIKITPAIETEKFQTLTQTYKMADKVIFMTTGRLHWIKGYEATFESLAILKTNGIDFKYKIVGEGKDYERIAFAAFQLGLKEEVEFLGKLSHDAVKKELEAANIYIQYSFEEGFCNAVLEAQAMGKLCIVSEAGGLKENVVHGQTGWVVPRYSPELLADQIMKVLLMEEKERKRISTNAMERVNMEFNLEKQEKEFLNFYKFI